MATTFRCVIMGAAGRDFHDFQTFFRSHPEFHVVAFTATQIPFIESRKFPKSIAGPDYDADIPIYPEEELSELIERFKVDFVFLSYSDLSHLEVMHKASRVQAAGAAFVILGPQQTQLQASAPVISVTAVRTGAGKSPLSQWLAGHLIASGWRVGVIRHPMPYGNLLQQSVQRFSSRDDLDRYECTVEEREEYEPYLAQGLVVYSGVEYQKILEAAERESDVILWDGGNNDYPFVRPDFSIVVADALRAGHETRFFPGETNFLSADVLVINKVGAALSSDVDRIRRHAAELNPRARILESDLEIEVDRPELISGRRVLVVEDGPTLTHGGMSYGAGKLAADRFGAADVVDPRQSAVGSIAAAYRDYPHLQHVLPALGYSREQCEELADTIHASGADVVVDASPAGLSRVIQLRIPVTRVCYRFQQIGEPPLESLVDRFLQGWARGK